MRRDRVLRLALGALTAALLGLPAAAQGTVTIGSNLGRAANASTGGCAGGTCTLAIGALDVDRQASGGIASPVNGTMTAWRITAGGSPGGAGLRVVRPLGGGLYTSGGSTGQITPAANETSAFSTQLPIQRGDLIGIDCCGGVGGTFFTTSSPQTSRLDFEPGPLAEGPGTAPGGSDTFEVLINADIEPSATLGALTARAKKAGRVKVSMDVPNAGLLVAGGGQFKRKQIQIGAAGPLAFAARAKRSAPRKAKLRFMFTPTGGSASTVTKKVKLVASAAS
jgi:hypothetical protein